MNKSLLFATTTLLLGVSSSFATLLVNENFNYSAGSINGVAATGTGLTGNYTAGPVSGGSSTATFNVLASSLTFTGHFTSIGGSLRLANSGPTFTEGIAGVDMNATLSGNTTLYSSSIQTMNTSGSYFNDWVIEQRYNGSINGSFSTSAGRNIVSAFGSGSSSARKAGVSSNSSEVVQATGSLNAGTNYLLVTEYAITGANITSATLYVFDQASYANYLANSTLANADANLATYSLFSLTDSQSISLTNFDYLQFSIGGGPTGVIDDYRLGTSIGDVVNVVPEPGTVTMAMVGMFATVGLLRRKRA